MNHGEKPANGKNFCTLYLVRHGETEWNKKGLIQGHHDSPLTENGVNQARAVAEGLKGVDFAAIFSSVAPRAYRTAEIINLERKIAIHATEALRERCYGCYEGGSAEVYNREFKEALKKLETLQEKERLDFRLGPGVESDGELMGRFTTKLREIALAYPSKNVLIVTHGGVLRTLLMHIGYAAPGELLVGAVGNGGYVKILCDGVEFSVKEVKGVTKGEKG